MGQPKQLLSIGEESLLRRAAKLALEVTDSVIVVLGAYADELRRQLDDIDLTVVVNHNWQAGMGTSLHAGLITAPHQTAAALFMLCDQPGLTSSHLHRLIATWRGSDRPMVASGYDGIAGVPAIFSRECFAELLAIRPETGAKQLLAARADKVAIVPFPDGSFDLDTPEDYTRWSSAPHRGYEHGRCG